jgi:hypothetical protein
MVRSTTSTRTTAAVALLAALVPVALVLGAPNAVAAGPAPAVTLSASADTAAVRELVTYVGRATNTGDQPAQQGTMIWKLRDYDPPVDGELHFNPNLCHADGQLFDPAGMYYRIACPIGSLGVGQEASSTIGVDYFDPGKHRVDLVVQLTSASGVRSEGQASHEVVVTAPSAPAPSPLDALLGPLLALLGLA